jgi:cobyrinic acid a,c-diamide synthase
LVTAEEASFDYSAHADLVEQSLDLDLLLAAVSGETAEQSPQIMSFVEKVVPIRIAVARDPAFCFCYPENLERLEAAGAELIFFSPLQEDIPQNIDGLYLPGGYPELYLDRLAANITMLERLRALAETGLPIYAECGGLLMLCEGLNNQILAGIFPAQAKLLSKRKALGYREVTFKTDTPIGPRGTVARGHEFHYSEIEMPVAVGRSYSLSRKGGADLGSEGFRYKNVLASYVHLHFGSNPQLAVNFVQFCKSLKN